MRILLASILNFVLFICYFCLNIKILEKNVDWTNIGGAMIVPRSLKTKGTKKKFQDRPNFFFFFKSLMNPLYLLKIVFPKLIH